MRTFTFKNTISMLALFGLLAISNAGCTGSGDETSSDAGGAGGAAGASASEDQPPATPNDICAAVATFPGWAKLDTAPATDVQGRDTVWYVAIPVRSQDEVNAISAAGVPTEFMESTPEIQPQSSDAGMPDPGQKSLCYAPTAAEIEWALVPGPVLNRIITTQAAQTPPTWEAIVMLPIPSQIATPSITFDGAHPLSDEAAAELGF